MKHSHRFPLNTDIETYIIMQDYGPLGLRWEETAPEDATREGCIRRLKDYDADTVVTRIVCFNIEEKTCRDVTDEMLRAAGWFDEDDEPHLTAFDIEEARGERIAEMRRAMA